MRPPDEPAREPYPFARLKADLSRDIEAYLDFSAVYAPGRRTRLKRLGALLTPSLTACTLFRLSHWAHRRGSRRTAWALAWANLLLTHASIAPASRIGPGLYIPHPSTGIVFHGSAGRDLRLFAGCAVGASCSPLHNGGLAEAPRLGDEVSVGAKAFVVGPVRVGHGARIAFNACVSFDVAPNALVVSSMAARPRVLGAGHAPTR